MTALVVQTLPVDDSILLCDADFVRPTGILPQRFLSNGKPDLQMCTPSAETQYLTSPAHTFFSDKTTKLQQVEYTS